MYRIEKDSLGSIKVPQECYWGAQTQRAVENFQIGHQKIPSIAITLFAHHKAACAMANSELRLLDPELATVIVKVCDEIIQGKFHNQFPLGVWQTGSGTQTNMNVNEVIANRGNEILGNPLGSKSPIHPNDHVNMGQSSNDNFPTVMHLSTHAVLRDTLCDSLAKLESLLLRKAKEFSNIISLGRTHLQDATPIRLSQHFTTFAAHIHALIPQLQVMTEALLEIPQGGTAVGNGINTHKKFAATFCKMMSKRIKVKVRPLKNPSEAMAHHELFQRLAGLLTNIASSVMKMANDIRLLSSGPRCGFGELILPANEPGSSIMPGKVNPTQIEALTMICAHVIGLCAGTTTAMTHGHLQLNVFKPLILFHTIESITLLHEGIVSFISHCLKDMAVNTRQTAKHLEQSLMLVTALSPHIGYDKAAQIALYAYDKNLSLKEAAMHLELLSSQDYDRWVRPESMLGES